MEEQADCRMGQGSSYLYILANPFGQERGEGAGNAQAEDAEKKRYLYASLLPYEKAGATITAAI
ncbi:hypothetical protein [Pontibacter russatus]|uniref:hypothetical protein n=1 Tax=Pontibacter russatus TaxID=2694929 RepID=UPI00137AD594|nr:hypothetical protein [Pontibacter russatus]